MLETCGLWGQAAWVQFPALWFMTRETLTNDVSFDSLICNTRAVIAPSHRVVIKGLGGYKALNTDAAIDEEALYRCSL